MRYAIHLLFCCFLALLAACGGGNDDSCPAGSNLCACLPSGGCSAGLACIEGSCKAPSCPDGTEGCPCFNGECGGTVNNEPLACMGNVCQLPTCPAGQVGCACLNGAMCSSGASCVDGLCRQADCIPGEMGCECLAGSCGPNLTCRSNVCIDQVGRIGGACRPDGTCDLNARCDQSVAQPTCTYCDLGSFGCQCNTGDTCAPGLACVSGLCAGDERIQQRNVPANPVCYSPCQQDIVNANGSVRNCSDEGLMEGCLDDLTCVQGNCVPPGGARRMCYADSNCPDFQQCIKGHCYSTCISDAECGNGQTCFQHVCRQTCSVEELCPSNEVCETTDNHSGFCMPKAGRSPTTTDNQEGSYTLSSDKLEFSNVTLTREVKLTNNSDRFTTFTVVKTKHTLVTSDGTAETKQVDRTTPQCTGTDCPMWWIQAGEFGALTQDNKLDVTAPPNCDNDNTCPVLVFRVPQPGVNAVRWQGTVEVQSALGSKQISLSYVERPEGQWAGKMVYFANFDSGGIDSTQQERGWLARDRQFVNPQNNGDTTVTNGLLQRWGGFRRADLDGWKEMAAVLTAVESEQWKFRSVDEICIVRGRGACYLYSNGVTGAAAQPLTANINTTPIPEGSSVLPMAMNLFVPDPAQPAVLQGRVVSEAALHYPGNPFVEIRFAQDPTSSSSCDPRLSDKNCVVFLQTANTPQDQDGLTLNVSIGGRYPKPANGSCAPGFEERRFPWLITDFVGEAQINAGNYERSWCVDYRLPAYKSPIDDIIPEDRVENRSLARGNPIPNGQVIQRNVRLLDGAMIDQSKLFILFRETYPSFLGGRPQEAYGYMLLERKPVDLQPVNLDGTPSQEYQGNRQPEGLVGAAQIPGVQCSANLLRDLGISSPNMTTAQARAAIGRLVNGNISSTPLRAPTGGTVQTCPNTAVEEVHYLCEETGLFNGGDDNTACWGQGAYVDTDTCRVNGVNLANNGTCEDGRPGSTGSQCTPGTDFTDCGFRYRDARQACPLTSNVTFFTAPASQHDAIVKHECQTSGTCNNVLLNWASSGSVVVQVNPVYTCIGGVASCDADPLDRRRGKQFYANNSSNLQMTAIRPAIVDAFRYKTRFQNRSGTNVGFTPTVCGPLGTSSPYCYDPDVIAELRDRIDCLLSIYQLYYDRQTQLPDEGLYAYLEENFSEFDPGNASAEPKREGFERLYAELLIMLGDDAYTKAFESRFDLAGINTSGFAGDQFEVDGLSLSGIAGFEMYTLHQAVQYYTMVLDRFYKLSDVISDSLDSGNLDSTPNFMSVTTVTTYVDRLIRASTQRSRAWSEIARRYQGFNEPALARRVAARAYTATYLESIALANTINRITENSPSSVRAQLGVALTEAQRRYSMALLDLGNVYQTITDDVTILGFEPDYIPFPVLGSGGANVDINAFERVYQFTQEKLSAATDRERTALAQTREFDTDEASFQSELIRLSRTYENQLADICGTFEGNDGVIYPAIEQFAFQSDQYVLYGDPCGFVGNGGIHEAIVNVDIARLDLQRAITELSNAREDITAQETRVQAVCDIQASIANARFETSKDTFSIDEQIQASELVAEKAQQAADVASTVAQTLVCELETCIQAAAASATIIKANVVSQGIVLGQQAFATAKRIEKAKIERAAAKWEELQQCDIAKAELTAELRVKTLRLIELEIAVNSATLRVNLALSNASKLRQQAQRVQLEMQEALGLTVNVEAAKNNPNVRIYRNDAVLNAEVAFEDALKEAYKLTLIYEYYTSQSYAERGQLFLIRMVSAGDYNLQNYVSNLRNSFLSFEEVYGNPDTRVMMVSLRDDILQIPRVGGTAEPTTKDTRTALLREVLQSPEYLNKDGYITIPFSTNLREVSPITRNHKILFVEINITGDDLGDNLGRVYLRQRGTSTIRSIGGEDRFYRFPQRVAVVNPYYGQSRELSQVTEIYRNDRLRDLPLINDNWELIYNLRDEEVNRDVKIEEISDIRIFFYYTDFTVY